MTPTMISSKVKLGEFAYLLPLTSMLQTFQNAIEKGKWYNKWVKVSDSLLQNKVQS